MLRKKVRPLLTKEKREKGNRDRRQSKGLGDSQAPEKPMKSNHRIDSKC